jgi:hypothetical protein
MPASDRNEEQIVRETAYFLWEREGRPEGRAEDHWARAIITDSNNNSRGQHDELVDEEEKVLAGRLDANMPALLTKECRADECQQTPVGSCAQWGSCVSGGSCVGRPEARLG